MILKTIVTLFLLSTMALLMYQGYLNFKEDEDSPTRQLFHILYVGCFLVLTTIYILGLWGLI